MLAALQRRWVSPAPTAAAAAFSSLKYINKELFTVAPCDDGVPAGKLLRLQALPQSLLRTGRVRAAQGGGAPPLKIAATTVLRRGTVLVGDKEVHEMFLAARQGGVMGSEGGAGEGAGSGTAAAAPATGAPPPPREQTRPCLP